MNDLNAVSDALVSSGVDWITVTAKGGEQAENLFDVGRRLTHEAVTRGNQKHAWSFSGFHGDRVNGVQFGNRDEEVIVRLSSEMAHDYWREVYTHADNVTRLDLQATLKSERPVGVTIRRNFEQAKRLQHGRRRPTTLSVLSTNNGPSTVYFGKRVSDRFGRIYDKGAESKRPEMDQCVRYEVELKGKVASSTTALVSNQVRPDLFAARFALEYFEQQGCSLGKL